MASDPDGVHNGPSTHTTRTDTCCGSRLQVVSLSRDETPGSSVELVRCSACGASAWRLDGLDVTKATALGALSEAFAPSTPAPKPVRVRTAPARTAGPAAPASPAIPTAPEPLLADLLAGWSVLGTTS